MISSAMYRMASAFGLPEPIRLVSSAELLQQPGDERVQRLLRVHHALLKHAVAANGGQDAME